MDDRFGLEIALDMLLGFHELDDRDPPEVAHLIELMRERQIEIVDILTDAKPDV